MTLRSRVTRLEVVTGGRVPTEHEMIEASRLLDRHFEAISLPKITAAMADEFPDQVHIPDPNEALLMRAAEAAGEIAAAEDVMKRYRRARGYREQSDTEIAAYLAKLAEIAEMAGCDPS